MGGVGLFFGGMWLLSANLKAVTGRRLSALAERYIHNRFSAFGWGALAGGLTQSMTSLTFIAVSMRQVGLISTNRALAVILGGNVGTSILVLIIVLDIELIVSYVLGIAGMAMASGWARRYTHYSAALFGLAILILGLILLRESVAPFAEQSWFSEALVWVGHSPWLSFLCSIVLTIVVQSAMIIILMGIGMTTGGILSIESFLMLTYGSWIGSSLILLVLSTNLKGTPRQVAMYQVLVNMVSCAIFMPILFIETYMSVPLVKAAILSIDASLTEQRIGIFIILTNVIPAVLIFSILDRTVRWCERLWPTTQLEVMSRTKYIHGHGYEDFDTALRLGELEQARVISMFSEYLDSVRLGKKAGEMRETTQTLISLIEEFLHELAIHCPSYRADDLNSTFSRLKLLTWLEEQFGALCDRLNLLPDEAPLGELKSGIVEGIDATLLVIADPSIDETEVVSDRGTLMRNIRNRYLSGDIELDRSQQANILTITNGVEQIFFLLSKFTKESDRSP